jgi:hypothetical protein
MDVVDVVSEPDDMTMSALLITKSNKIGGKKVKLLKNANIYPIQSIVSTIESTNLAGINHVSLCIYRINTKPSTMPFLQYLLFKNRENVMVFPGFNGGNGNILAKSSELYETIIGDDQRHYRGVLRIDDTLHVFYQYIKANNVDLIENPYKPKSDELWWCLMDEICNLQGKRSGRLFCEHNCNPETWTRRSTDQSRMRCN